MAMLREYLGFRPTMDSFAARLLEAFPPEEVRQWTFERARQTLTHRIGGEFALRNLFLEYCSTEGSARAGLIRKYAALASCTSNEIPALWVAAAKHVFPAVRSRFVDSTVRIQARSGRAQSAAAAMPLAGDLQVRLVYDFGGYLSYVTEEQLATWGQTMADVFERAVANLARLERPEWDDSGYGFFQLNSPTAFAESMLLLGNIVEQLPFGESAVLLPCNRGVLLAADGRSEPGLQAMLQHASRCATHEPWPMSATLCTRVGGNWQEFAAGGDAARRAHGLFVTHRAEFYAAQKQALDALHERIGNDVFTATYSVLGRGEHRVSSCVWTQGVVSLLPVTDWVALLPEVPEAEFKHVAWARLLEVCGELLQPTGESPPRFLVESFPDAAQRAALEAGALSIG